MKRYLRLAGIGFAVSSVLGYLSTKIGWVPWEQQLANLTGLYFSISGAYVVSFPYVFYDALTRKGLWAKPRNRSFGVPLLGASFGLLVLGWVAILGPNGLDRSDRFNALLCGVGPEPIWSQARDIIPKAELLGILNTILESWVQYAAVSALMAIASAFAYDTLKSQKNTT